MRQAASLRGGSEVQLVADVARLEAEPFVEAMRVEPALVGRQLDDPAAALAAFADRPLQQALAEPFAAPMRRDAHRFDLAAPGAPRRQPGEKADLQVPMTAAPSVITARNWFGLLSIVAKASR